MKNNLRVLRKEKGYTQLAVQMKTGIEQALLSKELATIYTEVPGLDLTLDTYALKPLEGKTRQMMADLEFRGFFNQFGQIMGLASDVESAGPTDTAAGGAEPALKAGAPGKETDGNMEKLFVTTADNRNTRNAGPETASVPDEGMGSLFGAVVPAAQVKEIGFAAQWQEVAAEIYSDPSAMVWFMAATTGEIPHLRFEAVRVLYGNQEYLLSGTEALASFTGWLAEAPNPKGTADSKEVFRTCFCQGMEPKNLIEDTTLGAYLDDPGRNSYALADLAWHYLGQDREPDCHTLVRVAEAVKQALKDKELTQLYKGIELPLAPVLARMELAGVAADEKKLDALSRDMAGKLARLENLAKEQAGDPGFNPNSPKQLGVVLFEKLGLPVVKKTKTGYSTDVKVLEELRGKHPLVDTILQYRVLAKLQSTYLEGLKPLINRTTGRIHTHFQQTVTVTGRLSSTDPNLQNIPTRTEIGRGIRALFVPGEGYDWLMSCDYSQIELRVLAHVAQDPLMLESFRENQDVHARTASEVFGVPLSLVSHEMRSRAKAVNFGIVYGISAFSLAQDIGVYPNEAKAYMEAYLEKYHGVRDYMKRIVEQARTDGYVTTIYGRRRDLPELKSSNFNTRQFGERVALNMPIQGTAADIIKLAMVNVAHRLKDEQLKARLLLQVHDELIVECPEEETEIVSRILKEEMEHAADLAVPLTVEVKTGQSWAEAH